MTARLVPEAEADVTDAFAWYSARQPELGRDFLAALDEALSRIEQFPESFAEVQVGIRRALMRRFPYCLFYTSDTSGLVVLGCFHARRDPVAWQRRAAV